MRPRTRGATALSFLALAAAAACSSEPKTGRMPAVAPLTGDLVIGVSTHEDVRRAIGEPVGEGGYLNPPDYAMRDVWFYEAFKFADAKSMPGQGGLAFSIAMSQSVLVVYFRGDRYDGYQWFSNAGPAAVK